eukprot:Hpha_TRINITY_DN15097_c2_g10::TRINITY_DN15097_c2_g10_i1::g.123453::m.123453
MQSLLLAAALPCVLQSLQTPPANYPTPVVNGLNALPCFTRPARELPLERLDRIFGSWWPNDTQGAELMGWVSGMNVSFSYTGTNYLTSHRGEVTVPAAAPNGSVAFEVRLEFGGSFDTLGNNPGVYRAVFQYAMANVINVNPFQVWDQTFADVPSASSNRTLDVTTVVCSGYCAPNYPGRVRVLSYDGDEIRPDPFPSSFVMAPPFTYVAKTIDSEYVKNLASGAGGRYTLLRFTRLGRTDVQIRGIIHAPSPAPVGAPDGALTHHMWLLVDLKVLWSNPGEFKALLMIVIGRAFHLNPYQIWDVAVEGTPANGGENDTYLSRRPTPRSILEPGYVKLNFTLCQEFCALNQGTGSYVGSPHEAMPEEPPIAAPVTAPVASAPLGSVAPAPVEAPLETQAPLEFGAPFEIGAPSGGDGDGFPTWGIVVLALVPVVAIVGIALYFYFTSAPTPETKALPEETNAPDAEVQR